MSLHTKYELDKLVYDGPTKTFKARQIGTGTEVYLHLLAENGDALAQAKLLEKIRSLTELSKAVDSQPVIEVGDVAESPYVATEVLASFRGLENWVEGEYREARARAQQSAKDEVETHLAAGDTALALRAVCQALEQFPDEPQLTRIEEVLRLLNGGQELCRQGSGDQGIELLWQAYRATEANAQICSSGHIRATLLDALAARAKQIIESDREAADVLLQQALGLDPTHAEAVRLSKTVDPKREEFIRWCLSQSKRLEEQGDRKGVQALVGQALAKYPNDVRLLDLHSSTKTSWRRGRRSANRKPNLKWSEALETLRRLGSAIATPVIEVTRHTHGMFKKKLPTAYEKLRQIHETSPLLPAALGAGVAIILFTAWWIGSRSMEQPPAPVAMALPVSLRSSPAGATLSIGGEECGTSTCAVELTSGSYQAEARLAGYRPVVLSFDITEGDITEDHTALAPFTLTLSPLPVILRISSDLPRGDVTLDDQSLGALEEGELEIALDSIKPGEHVLAVSGAGAGATLRFESLAGALPLVREALETRELRAVVVAGFGPQARLYSDAVISEAALDEEQLAGLPATSIGFETLAEGEHELELNAGGKTRRVIFDSAEGPSLAIFLQTDRNVGGLRIQTGEDGATIYLDGKKYRRQTRRGRALIYLYPNQYTVRVEKQGFRVAPEQTVQIRKGEQSRLDFKLTPLPTTATLKIPNGMPGATVLIDGNEIGVIPPNGRFSALNIEPGRHRVTIRKDLHQLRESSRLFEANGTVEVNGLLEGALGTLRVKVSPPEATARLSLRREGEGTDRAIIDSSLQLEAGTYTVTAVAEGFEEYSATIRLQAGESKTVRLELRPLEDQRAARSALHIDDWADAGGWRREGDLLTRSGGGMILAPADGGPGVYEFSALLRKGRRLEWVANHVDQNNYALFQIGKNYFHRTEVVNGRRSKPFKIPHSLPWGGVIAVQIEVAPDSLVHRLMQNSEWSVIDRWVHTGAEFTVGKFGFHIPRRDQIALRRFTFVRH